MASSPSPQDHLPVGGEAAKRRKFDRNAPVDAAVALEEVLLKAHRLAVLMGESNALSHDVSIGEWAFLRSVGDRQNVPLKEVSKGSGVSRQRVRKLVSELESKGLVTTNVPNAADRRTRVISATPKAAAILGQISQRLIEIFPPEVRERRARGLVAASVALDRVVQAMRRKVKAQEAKAATTEVDFDDDDD